MLRIPAILALWLLAASAAYPCSSKYAGRSPVLHAPPARPSSILILNNQSLRVYARSLKSTLKQLGHKVRVVETSEEITRALKSGRKYDIVMGDFADMDALSEQVKTGRSNAIAVPLISHKSKESEACPVAIDLSSKSTAIRRMIDNAMALKERQAKERGSKSEE